MEPSHRYYRPTVEGRSGGCSPAFFVATAASGRRLQLVGELDLAAVPALRAVLGDVDGDIEVDCSKLTFIDCAGLRVLRELRQACEAVGVRMCLVAPPQCLTRLLDLVGLDGSFDMRDGGVW